MGTSQNLLEERYGRKKTGGRIFVIIFVSVLALAFFSFAIYSSFFGKPVGSVELLSYSASDSNHMTGKYTALTDSKSVSCVFKAYDTNGVVVGYLEQEIPANHSDKITETVVVKTVLQASILKADACGVK